LIILSSCGISVLAISHFGIYNNDSTPYGRSYSQWIEKWWTWWAGIPNDKHPAKDYSDSERCSIMQDGPVWFLPDILPGTVNLNYHCNVPVGKSVLIPISTTVCDKGFNPKMTDVQLRICADNINTPVVMSPLKGMMVTVDGSKVNLTGLLSKTSFFNITYPDPIVDIWDPPPEGIQPGTYKGTATGYFLFLHDLSPGKHEIGISVRDMIKGQTTPDPLRSAVFDLLVQ